MARRPRHKPQTPPTPPAAPTPPTSEPPTPAPPDSWWKRTVTRLLFGSESDSPVRLTHVVEMVGVLMATGALSGLVQRLSSPALWMPPEYKLLLLYVSPVIASMVIFSLNYKVMSIIREKLKKPPRAPGEPREQSWQSHLIGPAAALLFVALFSYAMVSFVALRSRCIVPFQTDFNWSNEMTEASTPDFLDLTRSQILIPHDWPPALAAFLRQVEDEQHVSDGLQYVLTEAPYKIVKELQSGPGRQALNRTVNLFLMWYAIMMVSLACMFGCALEPAEKPLESLTHHALALLGVGKE